MRPLPSAGGLSRRVAVSPGEVKPETAEAPARITAGLIIVGPGAELSFRLGSLGVIPYIKVALDLTAIEEVLLGPGPEIELREQGIARLLAAEGLVDVEVTRSRAPFRG